MVGGGGQRAFFHEGYESPTEIYDKKGQKRVIPLKMYMAMTPTPEGFFLTVYSIKKDSEPGDVSSKDDDGIDILHEKKAPKSEENSSESTEINEQDPSPRNSSNENEDKI